MKSFSPGVAEKLRHYVYRLIDPRNGHTFYVGKGQGDRLFAHVNDQLKLGKEETARTAKLETIRDIRRAGLEVTHVVHRHGMKEEEAVEVEAALIDAIPGLTNKASGQGAKRGPMNALELERRYAPKELAPLPGHKLLYLKTSEKQVKKAGGLYEATRSHWKISLDKARQADYVIAVIKQICKGVFKVEEWRRSPIDSGKIEFSGHEVTDDFTREYVGRRIPSEYRKRGMASSALYGWNHKTRSL